jgi:hypothetical protein
MRRSRSAPLRNVPVASRRTSMSSSSARPDAVALGKALFWDMQVGSDGLVSCATCHFNAGADSRPGTRSARGCSASPPTGRRTPTRRSASAGRTATSPRRTSRSASSRTSSTATPGRRRQQRRRRLAGRLQLHLQGPGARRRGGAGDLGARPGLQRAGPNVRQVAPRNSPSVINAVFNERNFWDGRAQAVFNGVNGLGDRDPGAPAGLEADEAGEPPGSPSGSLDSSLAPQAVGHAAQRRRDVLLGRESRTSAGRSTARRQEANGLVPLGRQLVHPEDGVAGTLVAGAPSGAGRLLRRVGSGDACLPRWWASKQHRPGQRRRLEGSHADAVSVRLASRRVHDARVQLLAVLRLSVQMYMAPWSPTTPAWIATWPATPAR